MRISLRLLICRWSYVFFAAVLAAVGAHTAFAGSASTPALAIQVASYGVTYEADVTEALSKLVVNDKLSVVVNNDTLGGDPAPNIIKRLHVDYTLDGKRYSQDVDEGSTLRIPNGVATQKGDATGAEASAKGLVIDNGIYGPKTPPPAHNGADVASLLTKFIVNNQLSLNVNNDTMGGDPAPNEPKVLHIEYTYGGAPFIKDVPKNSTLTIPDSHSK